ncbi:mitochondrial carrier domain-containing protein, partial [Dimargaris cristalligena]
KSFLAGAVGGVGMILAGHPFDLIKVRQQTMPVRAVATPGRGVVAGFRGFYRGVLPPLATSTPIVALSFWGYDVGLRIAEAFLPTPDRPFNHAIPGADLANVPRADQLSLAQIGMAGAFSALLPGLLLGPVERIKVIMQIQNPATSMSTLQTTRWLYRTGGLRSLFQGTFATVGRDLPGNAFYFLTYEILCRQWSARFNNGNTDEIHPGAIFLFGGLAGLTEGITTLPIDTLKSRLQGATSPHQYPRGMRDVLQELLAKEGPRALFRGFTPAMLWAFPANAATFLCMELTYRFLNR